MVQRPFNIPNFKMRKHAWSDKEFDNQKSGKEQKEKQDSEKVEIFINKFFDTWTKFPKKETHQKKSKRPAESRGENKKKKIHFENTGGNSEYFIRNRCKSCWEDIPETIIIEVDHHLLEYLLTKSGYVGKEKAIYGTPESKTD